MQLDFTNLFNASGDDIDISYHLSLADFMYDTYKPLTNGVNITGRAYQNVGVVYLDLKVEFHFDGVCDRCVDEIHRDYSFSLSKIIVHKMENEDDDYDNYIVVENNVLDLDQLVYEEMQLFLPAKMLCKEDCKGLCQGCGKNLNYEKCTCDKEIDSRWSALSDLLIEE